MQGGLPWMMDGSLVVHRNDRYRASTLKFQATKFGRLEYGHEHATDYRASTTEQRFLLSHTWDDRVVMSTDLAPH